MNRAERATLRKLYYSLSFWYMIVAAIVGTIFMLIKVCDFIVWFITLFTTAE